MEEEAFKLAAKAHKGQYRKYTKEPYICHPIRVAGMIEEMFPDDVESYCAAMLHDVVEDTQISIKEVKSLFGDTVAMYVDYLTDKNVGKNRIEKKANYAEILSKAPYQVQNIKMADMIDNMPSIKRYDPDFWNTYRKEKVYLLNKLKLADPRLRGLAEKIIQE